ncbi:unnamed protein product [Echinostoma caproni]|uniref:GNAT family N-acetyltransferase n=1 Tax=Echinostoma caproni TaxID=27848 RepID=A0A183B4E5_9TREM|nr:unnamed protein product [Echinostoma caproni]
MEVRCTRSHEADLYACVDKEAYPGMSVGKEEQASWLWRAGHGRRLARSAYRFPDLREWVRGVRHLFAASPHRR